jgi:putative PEP-CTERM system histidine kinase
MWIAAYSYGLALVAYTLLACALITVWRGRLQGGALQLAVVVSVVWASASVAFAIWEVPAFALVVTAEVGRNAVWYAYLSRLVRSDSAPAAASEEFRWFNALLGIFSIAMALWVASVFFAGGHGLTEKTVSSVTHFGQVVMAVLGLAMVEQVYRNSRRQKRWAVKLLCFGLGGTFAYDLYMYSSAMLVQEVDVNLWAARGAINALAVPLLAVSLARNPSWSSDIFVSRHVAFHSAALLVAGGYLLLMAGAGYYIRLYGGTWGGVAQAVFFFGALIFLAVLLASGKVRAQIRVLLSKHFFRNKYEYREEWLRFTDVLADSATDEALRERVITGVANLMESPCGGLWERGPNGNFVLTAAWHLDVPPGAQVKAEEGLPIFLRHTGWVLNIDELALAPERYGALALPAWFDVLWEPWLVVPLLHGTTLEGFVVLSRSGTVGQLNWEDTDILKTVGRQAATHLAMMRVSEALSDAQRFDAFNRLSSYVVHDLKNVAAQLSLVASNSKRHMGNPEFIADAMSTVENATAKMNKMLGQLRKGRLEDTSTKLVSVLPILDKVIRARASDVPLPFRIPDSERIIVSADADRLATVIEHIVQNAQEATPQGGRVELATRMDGGWACIDVVDDGCGMDDDFIATRLFKPFDTTKGNAGMGIGVYESREFIQQWGGDLAVSSSPGAGTTFTLRFPIAPERQDMVTDASQQQGRAS